MSSADPDIDLDAVPPFPVVVVEVRRTAEPGDDTTDNGGDADAGTFRVSVNGQHITTTDELDAGTAAGIAGAADWIAARGLDHARVNAIAPDAHMWPLVVTAGGQVYGLDAASRGVATRRRGLAGLEPRHWIAIAGIALIIATLGALGAFAYVATRPKAAAPPPVPTAVPVEFPAQAPAGASSHAQWRYGPIHSRYEQPAISVGPDVLTVAANGTLVLLAGDTGTPLRLGRGLDAGTAPEYSTIDGQPVIVQTNRSTLAWRTSLDNPTNPAELPAAVEVPIGTDNSKGRGEILRTGAGPILQPTEHTAAVPHLDGSLDHYPVPDGGQPVTVDAQRRLVVLDELARMWTIDAGATVAPDPTPLAPPARGAEYAGVLGASRDVLVTVWTQRDAPADQRNLVAFHRLDATVDRAEPVATVQRVPPGATYSVAAGGRYLVDGSRTVVIDLARRSVHQLPDRLRARAVLDTAAYGATPGNTAARYALPGGALLREPRTDPPAIPSDRLANSLLVPADDGDGRYLYRLPQT